MTGKGEKKWPDGNRYNGYWLDGIMTGNGTFEWRNGTRYEGDWIDEKIDKKYHALGGFSITQIIAVLALGIGGDSALWITSNLGYFT